MNFKLRVGFSTTSVENGLRGGILDGIGQYTKQLYNQLIQNGHTVVPYAFQPFGQHPKLKFSKRFSFSYPTSMLLSMLSAKRFPHFSPDVDLFHFTDFCAIPCQRPSLLTIWDTIPITHPEWVSKTARYLAPPVLKASARCADHIAVPSSHAAEDVSRHFDIPMSKISILPCAIEDTWFLPRSKVQIDALLDRYGLTPGFWLTVGTLQPRKNIETLVRAYCRLSESIRSVQKFVIVGHYGWGCEKLRSYLSSTKSREDGVFWLNDLRCNEDLRSLYQAAQGYIFLSLYEGFGLPLLEAFASGIPVISSDLTSLPEVAGEAALLVDPRDENSLMRAMESFTTDKALRGHYAECGRLRAQQFRWSNILPKTVQLYKKLL